MKRLRRWAPGILAFWISSIALGALQPCCADGATGGDGATHHVHGQTGTDVLDHPHAHGAGGSDHRSVPGADCDPVEHAGLADGPPPDEPDPRGISAARQPAVAERLTRSQIARGHPASIIRSIPFLERTARLRI